MRLSDTEQYLASFLSMCDALKKFLIVKTFTMDTANVTRHTVTPSDFGTSVDWSDAYHHAPPHDNFKNFLAF